MLVVGLFTTTVHAASNYQDTDVPIGSSNEVKLVGVIEPSIMSVTLPTYVPFHISRSIEGENKVVSPRITVINNSSVPVSLDVVYTKVDLSNLKGTTWSNDQNVGENQIAIGFQMETLSNQMPTSLNQTTWLIANTERTLNITALNAYGNSSMYVVGTLGTAVPEDSTFSVTPTFVVSRA